LEPPDRCAFARSGDSKPLFQDSFGGPLEELLALPRPSKRAVDLSPRIDAWKAALTGIPLFQVSAATAPVVLLRVRVGLAASTLLEIEPMAGYGLAAIAGGFGEKWARCILATL